MALSIQQTPASLSPASDTPQHLRFSGLSRAIQLPADAPELSRALTHVLHDWPYVHEPTAAAQHRSNLSSVVSDGPGTFTARSLFVAEPLEGLPVASAVCAIVADLAQSYFEDRPGSLALHCGAFQIRNDLIALVGQARAGKSTLIARLAMEPGVRVFCDDVLPVDDAGFGVALGISPRVRIPLPKIASARFRSFIDHHIGPVDDQYGYVVADSVARHGSRAQLSSIVSLRRRHRARARLYRLSSADAVQLIAEQNMADLETAQRAFERIGSLANRLQRYKLVYSCLEEAVDLLQRTFGTGSETPKPEKVVPLRNWKVPSTSSPTSLDACQFGWKRAQDVQCREIDGAAFLFRREAKILWRMNHLAAAVWALLDEPGNIDDTVELLSEMFPQTPRPTLRKDLIRLFEALADENMIDKFSS